MVTVHDYGDQAVLLELADTAEVLAATDAVRAAQLPGVVDIVPAACTVLIALASPQHHEAVRRWLNTLTVTSNATSTPPSAPDVLIDVIYDGADLTEVARLTGLTTAEVIAAHTGRPWRAAFGGFAPGFAYLAAGDPRLAVPRRAEPRTRVPAGAVGLAGEFTGIYPRESPGGWQLIGHTAAVLWDINRPAPALITAGHWVQFRAVRA